MPGGHVGDRRQLERAAAPMPCERLAQDRVPDLGRIVDLLPLEVLEPVAALEVRRDEHVDVAIDRGRDHEAAVIAVVGGHVRAAPSERHAQRRPRDDRSHAPQIYAVGRSDPMG